MEHWSKLREAGSAVPGTCTGYKQVSDQLAFLLELPPSTLSSHPWAQPSCSCPISVTSCVCCPSQTCPGQARLQEELLGTRTGQGGFRTGGQTPKALWNPSLKARSEPPQTPAPASSPHESRTRCMGDPPGAWHRGTAPGPCSGIHCWDLPGFLWKRLQSAPLQGTAGLRTGLRAPWHRNQAQKAGAGDTTVGCERAAGHTRYRAL